MTTSIMVKIYTPENQFLKLWQDVDFDQISREIGGEASECVLKLGKNFDYDGPELALGNYVEIIATNSNITLCEGLTEKIIYRGYISLIEPYIDGKKEEITVHVLTHDTRLSMDILKDDDVTTLYTDSSNGLTVTAPGDAADIGLVLRAIINRYRAENSNPQINYTGESIPASVGVDILYVFEQLTYREAIDKVIEMCPENYFYFIDECGIFWLKAKAGTAKHRFVIGKDTTIVKIQKGIEKIKNFLLLWNGETGASKIYKAYSDPTSIAVYGRRAAVKFDYQIGDETYADLVGDKYIAEHKDPDVKVEATIGGSYFLENINIGDVCSFLNYDDIFADILSASFIITKIVYRIDRVEISVDLRRLDILDLQDKTKKIVEDLSSRGIPDTYTI